jgi:hypothetical protein
MNSASLLTTSVQPLDATVIDLLCRDAEAMEQAHVAAVGQYLTWRGIARAAVDVIYDMGQQLAARERTIAALREELRERQRVPKDAQTMLLACEAPWSAVDTPREGVNV